MISNHQMSLSLQNKCLTYVATNETKMGSPPTCIAGMATGPRTWGVSGVGVRAGPGRHQGGVQLVVTRPGETSAGLRSKSCNISPSDLFTFLSFSTEMLQFVFRGTAPNISISAILYRATGHRRVETFSSYNISYRYKI